MFCDTDSRARPQVDLTSAKGHSRRSDGQQGFADVRYAFNGNQLCASQRTDARCQKQTFTRSVDHPVGAQYYRWRRSKGARLGRLSV